MAEAVLDGISYFTNGLCIPDNTVNGVAYFTNGLVIPTEGAVIVPGGGIRSARDQFIRRAEDEAEVIQTLIFLITVIEDD